MSGMNGFHLAFILKPGELRFRIEKRVGNDWCVMGWAGSLEEASDLATHGLGGECRITSCTGREYRRSRGISERARVAA